MRGFPPPNYLQSPPSLPPRISLGVPFGRVWVGAGETDTATPPRFCPKRPPTQNSTVTDGSCAFPNNLIGCQNVAEAGNVKFLSDDIKLGATASLCPGPLAAYPRPRVFGAL